MSALSKHLADGLYNFVLRNINFTRPATVWVALHDSGGSSPAHPGKTNQAASNTEVSYANYSRQQVTFGEPTGAEVAEGENTNSIVFGELIQGDSSFDLTGLSIWSAQSGGQLLLAGPVEQVKALEVSDSPLVPIGSLIAAFGEAL